MPRRSNPRRTRRAWHVDNLMALEARRLLTVALSEFPLRSTGGSTNGVATSADGNTWVTIGTDHVGRINKATSTVDLQYATPTPNSGPAAIVAAPDGNLWFVESNLNQFAYLNPTTGTIVEVPFLAGIASGSSPIIEGLTAGPDGNIWFTEPANNRIGRIDLVDQPKTGSFAITEFTVPTPGAEPYGIASNPVDGNLWFAEAGANQIASLNPTTHLITEYPITSAASAQPEGVAVTTDGKVWFTETNANAVGILDPAASKPVTFSYPVAAGSHPTAITVYANAAIYFLEPGLGKLGTIGLTSRAFADYGFTSAADVGGIAAGANARILASDVGSTQFGLFTIATSAAVAVTVPSVVPGDPGSIASGPDGKLWFTQPGSSQIGKLDPSTGLNAEFNAATSGTLSSPRGITSAPSGLLWFADFNNGIGSVNPSTGSIVVTPLATPALHPEQIVYEPRYGNLWATDPTDNKIIRYNPISHAVSTTTLPTANSDPQGIAVGPDGKLYVTESTSRKIAVIDPSSGQVTSEIATPAIAGSPSRIVAGADGRLWFTGNYNDPRIAALTLASGSTPASFATYLIPNHGTGGESSGSEEIAAGPDGNIWFSQAFSGGPGNVLDRVNLTSGDTVTEFTTGHNVQSLVAGPDGNIWYTGSYQGRVIGVATLAAATSPTHPGMTTPPPINVTAGKGFGLIVSALTSSGGVTPDYSGPVTIKLGSNPGGSTLSGTTTVNAVLGVAIFSGLTLDEPGPNYTIIASTADGLGQVASSPFNVGYPATQVVVTSAPTSTPAGTGFSVSVAAVDVNGDIDATFNGIFKIALADNPGGPGSVLGGVLFIGVNAGVATFSDLTLNLPGQGYTLLVSDADSSQSTGLISEDTSPFDVTPAPATHLVVIAPPPPSVTAGVPFALTVAAENGQGQVDTGYNGPVTVSLLGSSGATLGGTLTIDFAQGQATFGDLGLTRAGQGYSLNIASGSLLTTTAGPIAVVAAAARTLSLLSSGETTVGVGTAIGAVVAIVDAFGNPVTTYTGTVSLKTNDPAVPDPPAYTFTAADGGIHIFRVRLLTIGPRILTASDPARSSSLTIQVIQAATGASLGSNKASYTLVQQVQLTSKVVRVAAGSGTPTGSVTFFDGTTRLGSAALDPNGVATLVLARLGAGTHQIFASYSGDSNDSAIQSGNSTIYAGDGLKDDFDGDGKADVAVYGKDPSSGKYRFKILFSSNGFDPTRGGIFDNAGHGFGNAGSIPLPADYFGDGYDAYALWTPNAVGGMTFTATSAVKPGEYVNVNFGQTTDTPVVADVDGDGKADFGVYGYDAGSGGYRFDFLLSSTGFDVNRQDIFNNNGHGFGNARSVPVVADFDGSGKAGFGLFNPGTTAGASTFTYVSANQAVSFTRTIGGPNDTATAADIDGDGKADLVLYGPDPAHAGHYRDLVLTSSSSYSATATTLFDNNGFGYGGPQATIAVADYDGDGKADFALYTPTARGDELIYQGGQTGPGVALDDFAATDIILDAPTYLRARKVRGS